MKIGHAELVSLLQHAAIKVVSSEAATYFAEETVETEIRKGNRTDPLKAALKDLEACFKHLGVKPAHVVDLPAYFSIDFKSHGPLLYLKEIHDELERRSNQNGIAMAAFTNSQSMHTLHEWVQGLAKRGLVAIAICNGGPGAVVPFNGTRGVFGTNPMAYGLPGENGEAYCIDMATSEIPFFEIMEAHSEGKPLRERSAVNKNGEFTTNASEALDFSASETDPVSNIVPIGGGYKGYYLVFLLELLTSGLIGMPSSPEMSADFIPEEHGAVLIVFNPQAMGTGERFGRSLNALHTALRSQTPKAGERIPIPGESNNVRFFEAKNKEVDVDDQLLEKLRALQ